VNDRLLLIKIKIPPVNMIVYSGILPTSNSEDVETEQMYDSIEELLRITQDSDNVIFMGDFNAVVEEGKDKQIVGKHGLGTRNLQEQILKPFSIYFNFINENVEKNA